MAFGYQWFGVMTGWAFVYGCMIGMASPTSYLPKQVKAQAKPPAHSET